MKNEFDKAAFIAEYNATGKPTSKKIPCSVTGAMVTMFGSNLHNRVKKFGSVEALLDGFVSRNAKPKKVKVVPVARKRKAKKDMKPAAPLVKLVARYQPERMDLMSRDAVRELTSDNCMRPGLFLDNGRKCTGCPYFENCACALKR